MFFSSFSGDATALHRAAEAGNEDLVESLLLGNHVDVNACARADWLGGSSKSVTPLHLATEANHREVVELLLAHSADVNSERISLVSGPGHCEHREFPLHRTRSRRVAALLLAAGANINAKATGGKTPLHCFAEHCDGEATAFLLKMGADIHAQTDEEKTPLHCTAMRGSNTELLLQKGAEVNSQTLDGFTALHYAVLSGNEEAVEALISAGGDMAIRNCRGETPLHVALSFSRDPKLAEALIAHGADVNAKIEGCWTPLDLKRYRQVDSSVLLLLEQEARRMTGQPHYIWRRGAEQGHS